MPTQGMEFGLSCGSLNLRPVCGLEAGGLAGPIWTSGAGGCRGLPQAHAHGIHVVQVEPRPAVQDLDVGQAGQEDQNGMAPHLTVGPKTGLSPEKEMQENAGKCGKMRSKIWD